MEKLRRNITLDYIYVFIRNFNLTQGVWIAYLGIIKGFTLTEIGILEGIFHVSSIIMEVPTGMVADLYGRRLSRILSVGIYALYFLILLFSSNFYVIALGLFLCGLSYTFESGSGEALVYDSLKALGEEDKFKRVLGMKEVLYQVASSIAILIGGYLAVINYELDFYFMLIVLVLGLIPLLMMKETQEYEKNTESFIERMSDHFVKSFKVATENKTVGFLIITGAILAAPVTTVFFYFQLYLPSLKYSMFLVGVLLASHALFGALGGLFADFLEKRYKEKLIIYIIPLLMIGLFLLLQIDEIIFIPFILLGFLDSVFYVVLSDYINKLVPSDKRATLLSFNSFAFSVVMIVLFPLIGYIGETYSMKTSFLTITGLVGIFYVILLVVLSRSKTIKINNEKV